MTSGWKANTVLERSDTGVVFLYNIINTSLCLPWKKNGKADDPIFQNRFNHLIMLFSRLFDDSSCWISSVRGVQVSAKGFTD